MLGLVADIDVQQANLGYFEPFVLYVQNCIYRKLLCKQVVFNFAQELNHYKCLLKMVLTCTA